MPQRKASNQQKNYTNVSEMFRRGLPVNIPSNPLNGKEKEEGFVLSSSLTPSTLSQERIEYFEDSSKEASKKVVHVKHSIQSSLKRIMVFKDTFDQDEYFYHDYSYLLE